MGNTEPEQLSPPVRDEAAAEAEGPASSEKSKASLADRIKSRGDAATALLKAVLLRSHLRWWLVS